MREERARKKEKGMQRRYIREKGKRGGGKIEHRGQNDGGREQEKEGERMQNEQLRNR